MASFKISALKPATVLDESASIPCVYNGKTYQLPISTLINYFGTGTLTALFSGDSVECQPNPISSSGTVIFKTPGMMSLYAGNSDPEGWLICNGREISRLNSQYADLFSAIGTTFGTPSNSSLFKIPNMSGLSVFGLDNMGGTASGRLNASNLDGAVPTTLGSWGGCRPQTLTKENCPLSPHSHSTGPITFTLCWNSGCGAGWERDSGYPARYFTFDPSSFLADPTNQRSATAEITITLKNGVYQISKANQTNVTVSHPHIPPLILLNWIIKL